MAAETRSIGEILSNNAAQDTTKADRICTTAT
jgi:hypothetical protein